MEPIAFVFLCKLDFVKPTFYIILTFSVLNSKYMNVWAYNIDFK